MNYEAIYHRDNKEFCYYIKDQLLIKIRTAKNDFKTIKVHYTEKWSRKEISVSEPMKRVAYDHFFDYYEVMIDFKGIGMHYCFELIGEKSIFYGQYTFFDCIDEIRNHMFECPLIARHDDYYEVPAWAIGKTVYQIFPERFCNVDSKRKNLTSWDLEPMTREAFLGGTIKGITSKLDYLKNLGVDVVYLCPIFKSVSNHKYDATDYLQIDPDFGTEADFKELVEGIHRKDMYIILDGVFNHSGYNFPYFLDVVKNGKSSPYYDWFYINDEKPIWEKDKLPNYETFAFYGGMPKLNTSNKELREYIFSVVKKWVGDLKIDGFRLDVPEEYSHTFIKDLKNEILSYKKDALVIGEVWHIAPDYLLGDGFDSVMNYVFRDATLDLFIKKNISVNEFHERLGFLRGMLRKDTRLVLWNLLDSHDTVRILRMANDNKDLFKQMIALEFSLTGMPFIYYGDCVGMTGDNDPDCRRGMIWDERQDLNIFNYYKKLIELRRKYKALMIGEYTPIITNNKVLAFKKSYLDEKIIIAINLDDNPSSFDSEYSNDLLNDCKYEGIIPTYGVVILSK